MKTGLTICVAVAMCILMTGCVKEMAVGNVPADTGQEVEVTFSVGEVEPLHTRSAIPAEADKVADMNIYVYADGMLECSDYQEAPFKFSLNLREGVRYNIYAIANAGKITPAKKEENISLLRYTVNSVDDFGDILPMAWSKRNARFTKAENSMEIWLERLVSRIRFSIDSDRLAGLRVKSVRLRQCAKEIYPFATLPSGGYGSATNIVRDCDFATENDLEMLNYGEEIFFYALENCQGTLLPDNEDPWAKTPDNLGVMAGYCTYLEVMCDFAGGGMYEGDVTYRFYAGLDNMTNFDVKRNTDIGIRLVVTGEGMRKVSWLVDADVSVMDGYAMGWVEDGDHNEEDLYIGELFLYGFEVADDLLHDYGGDVEAFTVKFIPSSGDKGIEFGKVRGSDRRTGMVEARCVAPAKGEIWLCDSSGENVVCLNDKVNILKPRMMLSSYPKAGDGRKVMPLSRVPLCEVNGKEDVIYMYLADNEGYNLNSSRYGFDLGLFSTSYSFLRLPGGFDSGTLSLDCTRGENADGGYAVKIVYTAENSGTDVYHNKALADIVFQQNPVVCRLEENNYGLAIERDVKLTYCPVVLDFVDNTWAEYYSDQYAMYSLIVDNPSNIPLVIDIVQLLGWRGNNYNGTEFDVAHLNSTKMKFISGNYYTNAGLLYNFHPELYCNTFRIYNERTGGASQYIKDGDRMIHAVKGSDIPDLRMVARYNDDRSAQGLCHLFDVSSGAYDVDKVTVVNSLSDGSSKMDYMYDGYFDLGFRVYTNNRLLSSGKDFLDVYKGISAQNVNDMIDTGKKSPLGLSVKFSGGKLIVKADRNINAKVDIHISGTVKGEVVTYPKGRWFKSQYNSCSENFSYEKKNVVLSEAGVAFDDAALQGAMNRIYGKTFFDSYNDIGSSNSYQHSAHPTSASMTMKIKLSGEEYMCPVKVTFENKSLYYYHAQENKDYYPSFSPSCSLFELTYVRDK